MTSHHTLGQHWSNLVTEERPRSMLLLSTLMVMALHAGLWSWLTQEVETETPAKPLVMQVSMIAMSAPKPAVAPPKPAPLPPPEKKLPPPPKTPPKPVVRKPPPVMQKAPDFAPSVPAEPVDTSPPKTQPIDTSESVAPSAEMSQNVTKSVTEVPPVPPVSPAPPSPEKTIKGIGWIKRPDNSYPVQVQRRYGRTVQGTVILNLRISVQGDIEEVKILESSGYELLDEITIERVKEVSPINYPSNCESPCWRPATFHYRQRS